MAGRVALHYLPGNSCLHRWDARCKLLGLLIVTATLLQTRVPWLILDSAILVGLVILSRLSLRRFSRDLRTWAIFLFILFLFQIFFTQGARLSSAQWLPFSKEGLRQGGFTCWRLGLILGYAVLFSSVTRPRELQDTVTWFLKPIPFLPERRVGLMVSLTLRFFSLILDQAEEVRLANKARLGDRNKNPFRRTKFSVLPILNRSFSRAEDVTLALAARGYRDDIPLHFARMRYSDLIPLLVLLGLLVFTRQWHI